MSRTSVVSRKRGKVCFLYDGELGFFLLLRRGVAALDFPRVGRDGFPRKGDCRLSLIPAATGSI